MNKLDGHTIGNSFSLKFTNTTNEVKRVTLFKEGLDSTNGVTIVQNYDSAVGNGFQVPFMLFAPLWNFAISQPFFYKGSNIITYPYNNNFWTTQTNDTYTINTTGSSLSGIPSPIGLTIAQWNEQINLYIRNNADITNLKSPSGQFPIVNVFFDDVGFLKAGFLSPQTQLPSVYNFWGISVQYPTDLTNRIQNIFFASNFQPTFNNIDTIPTTFVQGANGVIIGQASNVSYEEILQSQNGGAIQIESLTINIGQSPTTTDKASQLLQPYTFTKRDVNGNEVETTASQVIDPYQDQFSYSKVDLVDEKNGEEFILDGNTGFTYSIEPLTNVFLTYNYRKVSNLTYDTEEGLNQLQKEDNNLEKLESKTKYANIKILDKSGKERYRNFTDASDSKRNNYKYLYLLGGIVAIYYLLTKTNQK